MHQFSESVVLNDLLAHAPGQPLMWSRFLNGLICLLPCDYGVLLVNDLIDSRKTHILFSAQHDSINPEPSENKLKRLYRFNHFLCKHPNRIYYNHNVTNLHTIDDTGNVPEPLEGQLHCFGVSIPCSRKYALNLLIARRAPFTEAMEQHLITRILQNIISPLTDAIQADQRIKINSQLFHYLGGHFYGYIIVDHELRIIFSDPIFESLIEELDCITVTENRFSMKTREIEQKLLFHIERNQEATIHNQCHACHIRLIPIASLKNLYQWECYKDGFILTFTFDKDKKRVIDRLTGIYGLSRCEAVCALQFMNSPSISDIAANTFRSQETVRNHIKHGMQKMDVHSQAELMKKLITLASL